MRKPLTPKNRILWPIRRVYNALLRECLPRQIGLKNGVAVADKRPLDRTVGHPNYEMGYIDAVEQHVQLDDRVVIVGGGFGVVAVTAAHRAAHVHVYEGSEKMYKHASRTAGLNRTRGEIDVTHAVVGTPVRLWGAAGDAETVDPGDLPNSDVLCLDCEGSELEILRGLEVTPRTVIVEYHPNATPSVTRADVVEVFGEMGFEVVDEWDGAHNDPGLVAIQEEAMRNA